MSGEMINIKLKTNATQAMVRIGFRVHINFIEKLHLAINLGLSMTNPILLRRPDYTQRVSFDRVVNNLEALNMMPRTGATGQVHGRPD